MSSIRKHNVVFGRVVIQLKHWNIVFSLSQWRKAFRSALEWKLLLFPSNRDIARRWRDDQDYLLLLWRMHTAIVFHATWRLRNDIYFGETQAMSPNIANVQASFRSHYHFLFRHSSDWNIDGEALNRVLRRLGEDLELEGDAVISVLQEMGFNPPKPRNLPESSDRIWTPPPPPPVIKKS
ncbi:hypothetical protein P3T76_010654 [Phytophthora citrophthora]|uniref:Uncharacterized protein n=1 Tax=Phytophthora citrophthora TaxID=4793 RepID=A0AAD9GBP3_9STRA|nr:hypothetical protein P3T76_010654 [Phytophthora citrophthora]